MRIAVVYIAASGGSRLPAMAAALAKAFEAEGHRVEVLDSRADAGRLAGFEFVALGTDSAGLGGGLPPRLREFLSQSYGLEGKRSFAWALKSGLRPLKLLSRLMAAMEGEGMRIVYSEVLARPEEAKVAAHNVPVERK
jgi:hypothetical protein